MERGNRSVVATFYWGEQVAAGSVIPLADDALRHGLVRRLAAGDLVHLVSGKGSVARGWVAEATRSRISVEVDSVDFVPRPPAIEILAPVADRERMLWAAEKCVEHQVTSWRPVLWARSSSVANRGEGAKFADKLTARMRGALEQSGGAWMPDVHLDTGMAAALSAVPSSHTRIMLDAAGEPLAGLNLKAPAALAVGPEGGFEQEEIHAGLALGWRLASLGPSLLRFETAVVSAAAVVRAVQLTQRSS
ncbi:MAG: RsmE family RNA methyltransferase [Gemmatimonadota bacterium]